MRLEGKVAILTGGEGPLGRAVSKKFLAEGAKLVIGWYASEEWEEARQLIAGEYKGQFVDVRCDVTKEQQVENLIQKAKDAFGSIDILLNIVGHYTPGGMIWETETDMWTELMEVNLKSAFLCSKHALRVMLERGRGRIVFFPSRLVFEPQPGVGAYVASKAGLIALTNVLREELKDTNITVNSVMFSVLDTWRTRRMPNVQPDKNVKPSDVAELLSCLCSDECDALSGATLTVFGKH